MREILTTVDVDAFKMTMTGMRVCCSALRP